MRQQRLPLLDVVAIELGSIPFESVAGGGTAYTLTAQAGSYSLTGVTAAPTYSRKFPAAAGTYAVIGVAATLVKAGGVVNYTLSASAGSYALGGVAAAVKWGRKFSGAPGTYGVTGVAAQVKAGRKLGAAAGSYSYTGVPAGLVKSSSLNNYTLVAAPGAYNVTGSSARAIIGFDMIIQPDNTALIAAIVTNVLSALQADPQTLTLGKFLALKG